MEEILVELKLTYNIHVLNQTKKCYHISTTDTRFLNRLYLRKQCLWFSMLMIKMVSLLVITKKEEEVLKKSRC